MLARVAKGVARGAGARAVYRTSAARLLSSTASSSGGGSTGQRTFAAAGVAATGVSVFALWASNRKVFDALACYALVSIGTDCQDLFVKICAAHVVPCPLLIFLPSPLSVGSELMSRFLISFFLQ